MAEQQGAALGGVCPPWLLPSLGSRLGRAGHSPTQLTPVKSRL